MGILSADMGISLEFSSFFYLFTQFTYLVVYVCVCRLLAQFHRCGGVGGVRAVHVQQLQATSTLHKKILDPPIAKCMTCHCHCH